jgi:hypothetical protein
MDETTLAVSADHFAEDCRTLAAAVAFRPDFPPSLVRRITSHQMLPGCPLDRLAASYAEADRMLGGRQ